MDNDLDEIPDEQLVAHVEYLNAQVASASAALASRVSGGSINIEALLAPLDAHMGHLHVLRSEAIVAQVRKAVTATSDMLALCVAANGEGGVDVTGYIDAEGSLVSDPRWAALLHPSPPELGTQSDTSTMWDRVDRLVACLPAASDACPDFVPSGTDSWFLPIDRSWR